VYDITNENSFNDVKIWLEGAPSAELRGLLYYTGMRG